MAAQGGGGGGGEDLRRRNAEGGELIRVDVEIADEHGQFLFEAIRQWWPSGTAAGDIFAAALEVFKISLRPQRIQSPAQFIIQRARGLDTGHVVFLTPLVRMTSSCIIYGQALGPIRLVDGPPPLEDGV